MSVSRRVEICNVRGLHARASNAFSRLAQTYDCKTTVTKDDYEADAASIMELLSLAASMGCEVEIRTDGNDADKALNDLCEFVENRFGEDE